MRKLFALCLFCSALAFGQTATISGHLQDPGTSNVSSRTFVRFELKNAGGQQCRINGTALITPYLKDFTPNVSGVLSGTIYQNSAITCGTQTGQTQWAVTIWRDGKPQPSCFTTITAASVNLDSLACTNTTTVITPPTGDTTYLRLDGGNSMAGNIIPDASGTRSVGTSGARFQVNATTINASGASTLATIVATAATLSTSLLAAKTNGIFVVDGSTYATFQAAVTAACATSPVSPVFLPPGTYILNSALTWCTGLNIVGSGSGQADAVTCPTTITTTLGSGDLFYANAQNDIHMSNLCIKDIGSAGANAAIRITAGQRNVFEHIYISGPFLRGIQLDSSSTATASTIWNEFSDIHTTGLAANGIGCLLDSGNTANKPINGNKFWNVRCSGGTSGFGLKLTNSVQQQQINDNIIWCTECIALSGTGIQIDQGSTRGLLLLAPDSEGSTNGFVKQIANTVTVLTGNISSNSTNVTDAQAIFSSFINANVGGTIQTFGITPLGGIYADGYSMGGGLPSSNALNGAAGWTGKVGGATVYTMNTTSFETAQPLKLNEVAAPACSVNNDFLWGDSTDHILKTCQNNGPAQGLAPRVYVLGCNGTASAGTTLTMAWPGYATTACTNTSTTIQLPATSKGIAKNLRARCATAGVNASSGVFTLVDGGGNTSLTCTVGTGTTCSDTTHTPSVAAGDLLLVQFTTQGGETLANCAASFEVQ